MEVIAIGQGTAIDVLNLLSLSLCKYYQANLCQECSSEEVLLIVFDYDQRRESILLLAIMILSNDGKT